MSGSVSLGRIGGVRIAVHWSVLIVALLFVWSLAESSLPSLSPGHPAWAYWSTAAGATVLLLASLVAHEMAHAVVARHEGIRVEEMTLWLFGGVTELQDMPATPRAALRISAVGPATSLVLGVIFAILAWLGAWLGAPEVIVAAVVWLAVTNVVLAVFNLIPGAPLDGGRVLQALLWWRSGNETRAEVRAAWAGQLVGILLTVLGLGQVLAGAGLSGLWTAFIGLFLISAARSEGRTAASQQRLAQLRVADVMIPDPEIAPASLGVEDFLERHAVARDDSAYPVESPAGVVAGLVILGQARALSPETRRHARLADVALPLDRVPQARPDEPLAEAASRLSPPGAGCLLVFADGRLAGILTAADIAEASGRPHPTTPAPTPASAH